MSEEPLHRKINFVISRCRAEWGQLMDSGCEKEQLKDLSCKRKQLEDFGCKDFTYLQPRQVIDSNSPKIDCTRVVRETRVNSTASRGSSMEFVPWNPSKSETLRSDAPQGVLPDQIHIHLAHLQS